MWRRSSSSGSTPSRIMPPSRASAPGSSTSVCSMTVRSAGTSSSDATRLVTRGACSVSSTIRTRGTAPSDCFSPTRSRGPATPSAARATSRSRSCTDLSASRSFARSTPRKASSSTASSRSRIASSATSGRTSHERRRRPPIGVIVWSISSSSDPMRPPSLPSRISRCFSVTGSISRCPACWRKLMERTCARSAFWLLRRYATSAPAAAIAASWPSRPKPSRPRVLNCSTRARRAPSRSNCQGSTRVRGTPMRVASGKADRSAPSATTSSRGRSTRSSSSSACQRPGPVYSVVLNSPVVRSISATPSWSSRSGVMLMRKAGSRASR